MCIRDSSESVNKISKGFGLNGNGLTGKITGGLGKAIDSIGKMCIRDSDNRA